MKTINPLKIACVLLLGVTLSNQAQAIGDKYSRSARPAMSSITHTVKLNREDIRNLQSLLSQTDALHIIWDNEGIKLIPAGSDLPSDTISFEANNELNLEDWMLQQDYLDEVTKEALQDWMTDVNYLNGDINRVEPWMTSETYLDYTSAPAQIEPWMFDANYLSK